jgi:cell shape-determining protein MreC
VLVGSCTTAADAECSFVIIVIVVVLVFIVVFVDSRDAIATHCGAIMRWGIRPRQRWTGY